MKNSSGKEIEIRPALSCREEIKDMVGGYFFQLGKSDYFYHVQEVYAKTTIDTSLLASIIALVLGFLASVNIKFSTALAVLVYLIGKLYFYYDKKAVEHFNKSKIE